MFQKPFRVSQSFDVKSSVKRQIQQKLREQFSRVTETELWDNVLFPTKNTIVTTTIGTQNNNIETIPVHVQCHKIEIIEKSSNPSPTSSNSQQQQQQTQKSQQTQSQQPKQGPLTIWDIQRIQQQKQQKFNPTSTSTQKSQQQSNHKKQQQQSQQSKHQKTKQGNDPSSSNASATDTTVVDSIKLNMYTVNNIPMFVQLPDNYNYHHHQQNDNNQQQKQKQNEEKQKLEFLPTLFALHRVPHLLQPIVIHSNVSPFILSGADLMLPGLSLSHQSPLLQRFDRDEICSLYVSGNPLPFAVGRMTFAYDRRKNSDDDNGDATLSKSKKPNEGRGKAMIMMHVFNDFLWQFALMNSDVNDGVGAPDGFCNDKIEPTMVFGADHGADEVGMSETVQEEGESGEKQDGETGGEEEQEEKVEEKEDGESAEQEPEEQVSEKEMDDRMTYWFMETIKFHMRDDELPMDTSAIYSRMMSVINRTQHVDVRRTSFKKLAKFMKHVTLLKYIKTKDTGKIIVSINRSHPAYLKHEAAKIKKDSSSESSGAKASSSSSSAAASSASSSGSGGGNKRKVTVVNLYKPVGSLKEVFATGDEKEMYTEAEVRQKLLDYVDKHNLRAGTNNLPIKLDELLYSQLFHSKKVDSGYIFESTPPFKVVLEKLLDKMNTNHVIEFSIPNKLVGGEPAIYSTLHKGACKGIMIDVDRVMGNKSGTRINGLAPFLNYTPPPKSSSTPLECPQFHEFIKLLKTKVSTGIKTNTDVAPNHDNKKEPEVFMQGNNSKIVQDLLMQEYSIHPTLIHVSDNTQKKKKK